MPKLLFLACYFPPAPASGSVRAWNIAKSLARLGWDVTVVTPHASLWRYANDAEESEKRAREEGITRIPTGHRWRCLLNDQLHGWDTGLGWFVGGIVRTLARRLHVDMGIGWIPSVAQACSSLKPGDVDLILASAMPFTAFTAAKRLSQQLRCPYVLDYRDPWTENPHAPVPAPPGIIRQEESLVAGCAAVTIVSPSWALAMDQRFHLGSRLHVVTNGYDPEDLACVKAHEFGHFAIVYTGTFYPPKRVISPVLTALRHLKDTWKNPGPEWHFHYYGDQGEHVRAEAERLGLTEDVVLHGRVSRNEALSALRGAGLAVVIASVEDQATLQDKGIVTGKVFESLGLGVPVLLVAPRGSDVEAIAEATELAQTFAGSEVEQMASFMASLMSGRTLAPKNVEAYSWGTIGKKLDAILREVLT